MADSDSIFSSEALTKLRTPDRIDKLLGVTTPISWMALAAISVLLLAVACWSILGAFTTKADGQGLILDAGGVARVTHAAPGKVTELLVRTGSHVKKGDLIARMEQPAESAKTRMAQHSPQLQESDKAVVQSAYQYDEQRTAQTVQEHVYSAYDGIVDEVIAEPGTLVASGSPIVTIRRTQADGALTGVLYVPADKAKRIEPGMNVQVQPSGTDASQAGSLVGVVRTVSLYPVSAEGMRRALGSDQLVQSVAKAAGTEALAEVRFDLVKDPNSASGFLWTTEKGGKAVAAGSACTGSIIIDRKPPIQKVFYKIGQWLRSR